MHVRILRGAPQYPGRAPAVYQVLPLENPADAFIDSSSPFRHRWPLRIPADDLYLSVCYTDSRYGSSATIYGYLMAPIAVSTCSSGRQVFLVMQSSSYPPVISML